MTPHSLNVAHIMATLSIDETTAHWFRQRLTPTSCNLLQTISIAGSEMVMALLPTLSRWRWRAFWTLAGLGVIGSIGFSRIALGAHYLTDVVGAMAFGIAWIGLTFASMYLIRRQFGRALAPLEIRG